MALLVFYIYVSLLQSLHVRSGTLFDLTLSDPTVSDLTVLLELFNAKLPLERYWPGLRPWEVEPGGELYLMLHRL